MSTVVQQPDNMDVYLKDKVEQINLSYLLSCDDRMKSILTLIKYIFSYLFCVFYWNLVFNFTFNKAIAITLNI